MFDALIDKVEKLTLSVSDLVQTVNSKLSENSNELKELGNRIDHNKESIVELKNPVKQMTEKKAELAVHSALQIQTS